MTFSGTGTSKKITFGSRNEAKLTGAQLALVTDKGWVLGWEFEFDVIVILGDNWPPGAPTGPDS